jgi:hypothetical protein
MRTLASPHVTTALLATLVLVAVCQARADQSSASQTRLDGNESWSPVVDGLRGRMFVTAFEAGGRPQLRIDVELENLRDGLGPLEIPWREPPSSLFELSLEDQAGTAIPRMRTGGNEWSSGRYWLAIPMASSIRMTIARTALEHLADGRTLLRPFTDAAWDLSTVGSPQYYLRAMLSSRNPDEAKRRVWLGPLPLPRVALPPLR